MSWVAPFYTTLVKILMLKSIETTKNYLYKLIKKKRHKNMSMYTVRVSLAKSEQVFLCYNQLNSFNATDLLWPLKVTLKSFIQSDSDFFHFHLLFLKFLTMILKFSLAKLSWCFWTLCLSMCDFWSLPLWSLIGSCMRRAFSPMQFSAHVGKGHFKWYIRSCWCSKFVLSFILNWELSFFLVHVICNIGFFESGFLIYFSIDLKIDFPIISLLPMLFCHHYLHCLFS